MPVVTNESIILDADGDAILDVAVVRSNKTFEFLISTKVLSLASPVFAKLFGPHFLEGSRLNRAECPHIKLYDDDPCALEVILKSLHYQGVDQLSAIDAKILASIAVHCDKYDYINASRVCASELNRLWLISYRSDHHAEGAIAGRIAYGSSVRRVFIASKQSRLRHSTSCLYELWKSPSYRSEEVPPM